MRWTSLLIGVLAVLLIWPASAVAVRSGGHNPPTRKLEAAFKVLGGVRAQDKDGCYPAPRRAAKLIEKWSHARADIAGGFHSLGRWNVVYVIAPRSSCERVLMGLRARGRIFVLDTDAGDVFVRGERDSYSPELRRAGRGPLRALSTIEKTSVLDRPDRARRLLVRCPKGSFPLGGGMVSDPPVGADGEGVYPHSYERLGTQRGFHITALVIDPSPGSTTARSPTIQAVCGRGLVPRSSPHRTVFVRRNGTNAAVARCPRGQYLFSGGFQRTNFTTPFLTYGGNYVTESRAISPRAWRASGAAIGRDGGELTAIAHCARSRVPLITETSSSTAVPHGGAATATTATCPAGLTLTAGGFSFNGSHGAFFSGSSINDDGTWSATGYGYLGSAQALTAHGYCLDAA